jgi:hypothetical protein
VDDPLTQAYGSAEPEQQLEFWHQLADRPFTTNDEAFHGLLLYLDGTPAAATYEQRVTELKSRGLLQADFDDPAGQAVSRGTLAVAIARSLKVPGGLMYGVSPQNPRYAVRELVFLNLYPPMSSPNQTFTGSEFLGIIGRMEDWQRGNPADVKAGEPAAQQGS